VVTPSVRLSREAAARYGTSCYDATSGKLLERRVAVCLPSLLRVPAGAFDAVVLDEWEELCDLLHSPKVMSRHFADAEGNALGQVRISGQVYSRLEEIIQRTLADGGRVIVADAFFRERGALELQRLSGGWELTNIPEPALHNSEKPARRIKYDTEATLLWALLGEAMDGGQGTVATDRKWSVEVVAAMLQGIAQVPKEKILQIHSGTETPPTSEWDSYDWIIYNQAAGSGISYDGRGRSAWLMAGVWGPEVTGYQLAQMQGRHRHPTVRHAYVRDHQYAHLPWSREEVEQAVLLGHDIDHRVTWNGGNHTIDPRDGDLTDSFVNHRWAMARAGRNAAGLFWQCCPADEVAENVDMTTEVEMSEVIAETKKAVVQSKVVKAQAARQILSDRYQAICEAQRTGQGITQDVAAEEIRYRTVDRWGVVSDDLIADSLHSRSPLHEQARLMAEVAAVAAELVDTRGGIREREKTRQGEFRAHASHRETRARLVIRVLAAAGLPVRWLGATWEQAQTLFTPVGERCVTAEGCDKLLGTPDKTKLPPMRVLRTYGLGQGKRETDRAWLGRILRMVGLKQKRHHTASGFHYSLVDLTDWVELTRRHYGRATGRHVDAPEEIEAWAEHPEVGETVVGEELPSQERTHQGEDYLCTVLDSP
jgi:hypothetical protein